MITMAEHSKNILASCSVESLLGVPLRFIFRETQTGERGDNNHKSFLFSKSEVTTLLRVTMLSSELDTLLSVVYEALYISQTCKSHRRFIEGANQESSSKSMKGSLFLAILPTLNVHLETAEDALSHATCESFGISRILNELESCANDLGKFAEQNYTLADQLDHFMAPETNNRLSDEKRAIAEVEEAVVKAIENLIKLSICSSINTDQKEKLSAEENSFISMCDLCESLFPLQANSLKDATPSSAEKGRYSESQVIAAEALQGLFANPSDED